MPKYDELKREILLQLKVILESNNFSASNRLKDFLRFLVEETVAGREHQLKAHTIGRQIFNRGDDFDSLTDPVVRVEAGKLRNKLNQYYLNSEETGTDKIHIDIPKGSYVPSFKKIVQTQVQNHLSEPALNADQASIAILPFKNIGGLQEVDCLLSGLAEELTLALTKFEDLTVISARGMGASMEASSGTEEALAHHLGVRFILSGNAQFVGTKIRLRIDLIDTQTRKILWAERFESSYTVENLFNIIDSTVTQVASKIGDSFGWIKRTLFHEIPESKRTEDLRAYEAVLAYHYWAANLGEDRFKLAKAALEQAIQADSDYALAYGMLSDIYATHYQWGNEPQPEMLKLSEEFATRALTLNPQSQYGLWSRGYNYFLGGDTEQFLKYARASISINPADTYLTAVVGVKIAVTGHWDEGRELIQKACSLNPFLPNWYHTADSLYCLVNGDLGEALHAAKQITSPSLSGPMFRTAIYGAMGQQEEAAGELWHALEVHPNFKQGYKELVRRMFFNEPLLSALMAGFSKAGL